MKLFTFIILSTRVLICTESKRWWEYWIFLEINSLAFILYMYKEKKKEKIFVFLIFQTLASTLFIVFIFFSRWSISQNIRKIAYMLMMVSILIKIGMFPFHTWIIKIINNLSWFIIIMLFSWQKLIPLYILIKMAERTKIIFNRVILSIFMLNFIIIKISNLKILITVSSIMHNTWIFAPLLVIKELSIAYLTFYSLILLPLLLNFSKINIKNVLQQTPIKIIKKEIKLSILSIRGIPPSIGFLIKIAVVINIIKAEKKMITLSVLVISSCVAFFVYLQIFIKYFLLEKRKNMTKNYLNKKNEIKETSWVFIFIPLFLWL